MIRIGAGKVVDIGYKHAALFISVSCIFSCIVLAEQGLDRQPAGSPQLTLPVKCEIGQSCLIQKLVDHDPTLGRRDYRCGTLTTDGHDGVDIRLRTLADMRTGYAVVAAASGTVLRIRDGEPDSGSLAQAPTAGREAGNGVVIDHGNGWETQYSHLAKGSIAVRPGQKVTGGQQLGLIGLSGKTEFPHLHFSVRLDGKTFDPFNRGAQGSACSQSASPANLWAPETARALSYTPSALISLGLSAGVPPRSVLDRDNRQQDINKSDPIILWADVIGAQPGDVQLFEIIGPDGQLIHRQESRLTDGGLSWFAYSGKRAPTAMWLSGTYTGRYILKRDNKTIIQSSTKAILSI
jgi:hypothetical protein